MVEVDGLPRVEHDGAVRRGSQGAHEGVQAVAQAVEAGVRPRQDSLGGRVAFARGKHDLGRVEQLSSEEAAVAGWQRLDARRAVAAPGMVQCPHLARAEAETGGAEHRQERGVVAGAAATLVAEVQAVAHGAALWPPLAGPQATEVEKIARAGGNRQSRGEAMDLDAVGGFGAGIQSNHDDAFGRKTRVPADREQHAMVVVHE